MLPEQPECAAADVIHPHALKTRLDEMLRRENRMKIAKNCFEFLNTRAVLDILGMANDDVFSHTLNAK